MSSPEERTERILRPHFRESLTMAVQVMRTHRLRSALVIVGVCIGVMTLMGMVSIMQGVGKQIERDIKSSDETVITLAKFDFLSSGDLEESGDRPDVSPDDAEALSRLCPAVDVAEFYIDANEMHVLHYRGTKTRMVGIAGSGRYVPIVFKLPLDRGRYFTEAEITHARSVIVLGAGPADVLFADEDPIGKRIRVGQEEYEVVGTFAKRKSIFGEMGDAYAMIPWSTYEKKLGRVPEWYYVYVTVREGYEQEDVMEQATAVMRMRHKLKADEPDDFHLIASARIEEFVSRITGKIALVLVVLSSIGLTVGGIGVMNIMLISVTERTNEIGLRKAVGARSSEILLQVLIESGVLTGIGGAVGLALGLLVAWLISSAFGVPFAISLPYALGAVVFYIGVGSVFGRYPARRAARMVPIQALRQE